MCFFVLICLESLSKNRTIVKSSRTMGGFEIFQNRTIAKSVLIETVLWGDFLYLVVKVFSLFSSFIFKYYLSSTYKQSLGSRKHSFSYKKYVLWNAYFRAAGTLLDVVFFFSTFLRWSHYGLAWQACFL